MQFVQVHVQSLLRGISLSFDITADTTVLGLKTRIAAKQGVEPDRQRLVFVALLDDDSKVLVRDLGVQNASVIHLSITD